MIERYKLRKSLCPGVSVFLGFGIEALPKA